MNAARKKISYAGLFLLLLSITAFAQTPRLYIQNDTDKVITGAYVATILNDDQHTEVIQDRFPVPTGRSSTPQLPYYLIKERIAFTDNFDGCTSTVVFTLENRGGSFNILQPSSDGNICMVNGLPKRFSGTLLADGFTILLLEEVAP